MARKLVDCSKVPNEKNCTLYIEGDEDEVVRVATEHTITFHGNEDTPELREEIRSSLEDVREEGGDSYKEAG